MCDIIFDCIHSLLLHVESMSVIKITDQSGQGTPTQYFMSHAHATPVNKQTTNNCSENYILCQNNLDKVQYRQKSHPDLRYLG